MKKPSDNQNWEEMLRIIDGLNRDAMAKEAWIIALVECVSKLEAAVSGKTEKEVREGISARKKFILQKLYERLEKKNPQLAAEMDTRDIDEIL
jgi:hypothetical protein